MRCPHCNEELKARPTAPNYRPPFVPHRDWCEQHGYQPVPPPDVIGEAVRRLRKISS